MRRLAVILSGLLAVQVAGAVALAVTGPDYGAFKPSEPLVVFDPAAVQEISIDAGKKEGEKEEAVVLRREGEGWTLPGLYGFPADGDKVAKLMENLASLKRGLPVATSGAALERFKVTEESHERRIVLNGDDGTLGEVLIGTSPSFRQVHARTPEDDVVFSVAFETYEAGTRADDWMDRQVLHIPEEEIERIVLPTVTLARAEDKFVVEDLGEGEEANAEAVSNLVDKIARLSFSTVEGKGEEALARLAEPALTVTVERKEAPAFTLRLAKLDGEEDYLLASSTQNYLFRAAKYAVQPLVDAKREGLVKAAQTKPESPVSEKQDGGTQADEKAPDEDGSG